MVNYAEATLGISSAEWTTLKSLPFDQATQMQSVLVAPSRGGDRMVFAKGSPKAMAGQMQEAAQARSLLTRATELAADGYRLLAIAHVGGEKIISVV